MSPAMEGETQPWGSMWLFLQAVTRKPSLTSSHPEATSSEWRSAKPTSPSMER